MNDGRTIFAQLMEYAPHHHFRRCVERYRGNARVRRFRCWDQFLCMAFGQLTYRDSLRDIEACLRAMQDKLYHAGFRARICRNTLAVANEKRDWRIYADFAQILIQPIARSRNRKADPSALPQPLAGRALLQVDQAAPPDQSLLWHLGQRGEDPDLDRDLGLCARGHSQEAARQQAKSLHNSTDPQHYPLRKNRDITSTGPHGLHLLPRRPS